MSKLTHDARIKIEALHNAGLSASTMVLSQTRAIANKSCKEPCFRRTYAASE